MNRTDEPATPTIIDEMVTRGKDGKCRESPTHSARRCMWDIPLLPVGTDVAIGAPQENDIGNQNHGSVRKDKPRRSRKFPPPNGVHVVPTFSDSLCRVCTHSSFVIGFNLL